MRSIYGIVPPITTPFDAREEVVEELIRADVRHLIEEVGVHGLAVGGSTGEGQTLSTDELRRAVALAVEEARGRVPVIAGIIVDSTRRGGEVMAALTGVNPRPSTVSRVLHTWEEEFRAWKERPLPVA